MEKDFHLDCFVCEECNVSLNNGGGGEGQKQKCFPIGDKLLCYDCHLKYIDLDGFTKNILINSTNENVITIDKKK